MIEKQTMNSQTSLHKYSETQMLQHMVLEKCARLPRFFETKEQWHNYRKSLVEFLQATLPIWTPDGSLKADQTSISNLGNDLVVESVDVPLHGEFRVPVHVYRRRRRQKSSEARDKTNYREPPIIERRPAILVCPGYAQMKNDGDVIDMCMALARAGFIAVSVEYGGTGERADRPEVTTDINNVTALADLCGVTNVGLRVYTNRAVLTYIAAREGVDESRIGITGLCQGSIISWYTAAVDERCAAVALLCGATTYEAIALEYVNRQGGWSGTSPYVYNILAKGDIQHIIGCIAPRPLFVQNNLIDKHWPLSGFESVKRFVTHIYDLLDNGDRVRFNLEHGPHAFAEPFLSNIVSWFADIFL